MVMKLISMSISLGTVMSEDAWNPSRACMGVMYVEAEDLNNKEPTRQGNNMAQQLKRNDTGVYRAQNPEAAKSAMKTVQINPQHKMMARIRVLVVELGPAPNRLRSPVASGEAEVSMADAGRL
ncbi:predicted protein [Plenodomus lingam JN3]|uniref:Predicted protein n=1 Tax=Leptosphaeria maculans (strain JN3 / isolate v23.1.3 / race Av1-4-5-6-7-8) TaxID=985895 RepID=E4ZJR5_LEPMJ|nr:predicted protein [Plenodomus lingam JN3]CBX91350.1 predicted protein [Plenodomus lingam JN3]